MAGLSTSPHVEQSDGELDLRTNFFRMSVYFGLGHGVATAPLSFASSALDADVGYCGNSLLYTFTIVSALLLAVPVVEACGLKHGLVSGMSLYAVYVAGFALATLCSSGSLTQWVLFSVASISGGVAAGVLWTAEGGYLSHTATQCAEAEQVDRESVTAALAGEFAFYYLLAEVLCKLLFSVLMGLGVSIWTVGFSFAVLTLGSAAALSAIMPVSTGAARTSKLEMLLETVNLWRNPNIWLLSPTNLTFGFAAAYMTGYFPAHYLTPQLGISSIGYFGAVTVGVAALMAKVFTLASDLYGKSVPLCVGAACFGGIPLIMIMNQALTNGTMQWGWGLLIFSVLQGSGRAVYESTNKAIFSDFFNGADAQGAFANCFFQMSVASALCFLLQTVLTQRALEVLVLTFALATPMSYYLTRHLNSVKSDEVLPLVGDKTV